MKKIFIGILATTLLLFSQNSKAQNKAPILPGAYQTSEYLTLLKNKRVGLFTNQTATISGKHLIDTLKASGIKIQKIFTPEHGLRGTADAGEKVNDEVDIKTGIKIVSLYGKKNAPDATDLLDVDILLFDVQDVGTRFYTYIYSLQYFMEAAMAKNKPLIVLDRPNPNGHYIDGPVLEAPFTSGVGRNPIPIVYGMTIGEYALMARGEHWMKMDSSKAIQNANWSLTVIRNKNYDHKSMYTLDVAPSPNLPNMNSIYWYATTCLVEGSVMSEGRGTEHAFAYIGHPSIKNQNFSFTPGPRMGAMNSKLYGQKCYGWDLTKVKAPSNRIDLALIIEMYKSFPQKDS
ncbi:MAG: exo-beta-N-acetylmuramidase NamZ domain-containing protein, partial [Sediminibacterium sp.]